MNILYVIRGRIQNPETYLKSLIERNLFPEKDMGQINLYTHFKSIKQTKLSHTRKASGLTKLFNIKIDFPG